MLDICITFTVLQMKRYEEEVREEQARRKPEGMTAKYKSLKKRSRKHGCSSNTDIAPEEDRKKAENNEIGCSRGTITLLLRKI